MSHLVILESPAKAGTVKNHLGSGYKVIACKGHVRDLPKSTLGVDIENHFTPKYINIRGKGELIAALKKEAKAADRIYLATDPDREGEAISWHLAITLGIPLDQVKRVTFNELTKSAIRAGIKNPRMLDMGQVNSQQTRRILDRIVGYKLSPLLWHTVRGGLSAGRVQSVATRIIVERENEIRAFVPVEYWTIDASLRSPAGEAFRVHFYGKAEGKTELPSRAAVDEVLQALSGDLEVSAIKKTARQKNPPPPFTTSTMQQEASRKLGFQSARIMRVAQELYEGINVGTENGGVQGLITYMRTDSLRISAEATEAARQYITGRWGETYCPSAPRVYKTKANAQDAHEAIHPANLALEPDLIKKYLTPDQYKLYRLIYHRFLACQMASAELDVTAMDFTDPQSKQLFRISGTVLRFPGYLTLTGDPDEEDSGKALLPALQVGDLCHIEALDPVKHFTEPPARYNEASLINFLEEKGIGRPSTYTPIITTILSRGYVIREGRSLKPTPLGEVTTELMRQYFPDIVDYTFTAQMEDQLDKIEQGELDMQTLLSQFYTGFADQLQHAESCLGDMHVKVPDEETDIVCEKCGAKMVIKNGRYGKFAACPNYPTCHNTKPIDRDGKVQTEQIQPQPTDLKCELCGADMVLRSGRFGSFYACSRYPECKYTRQITHDIGVACPECGGKIVSKRAKNRSLFYSCEHYPTCKFSSWDLPLQETCPQCGKILFRKKGKPWIVCHDKDCGYKREAPEETPDEKESPAEKEPTAENKE